MKTIAILVLLQVGLCLGGKALEYDADTHGVSIGRELQEYGGDYGGDDGGDYGGNDGGDYGGNDGGDYGDDYLPDSINVDGYKYEIDQQQAQTDVDLIKELNDYAVANGADPADLPDPEQLSLVANIGIDPEVIKQQQEGCSTDVGKACAGVEFCSKFAGRYLEACTDCSNEVANGDTDRDTIVDLSLCNKCRGKTRFKAGKQEHKKDLERECKKSELETRLKEGTSSSNKDFADKTGACACLPNTCYQRDQTPSKCGTGGGRRSCQVSPECSGKNIREYNAYWGYYSTRYLCCK